MRLLSLCLLIVITASCRDATQILAEYRPYDKNKPKSFVESLLKAEYDEEMRSATILVYPNPNEVTNFEYAPAQTKDATSWWERLMNLLPYTHRHPRGFDRNLNNSKKIEWMVVTVLSMSEIRDTYYQRLVPKEVEQKRHKLAQEEYHTTLNDNPKFKCYRLLTDSKQCKILPGDDTRDKPVKKLNCKKFLRYTYHDLDAETKTLHDNMRTLCEVSQKKIDNIAAEVEGITEIRKRAKEYVVELLSKAKEVTGINYLFACNTHDDPQNDSRSLLKLSKDRKAVENLKLFIDFSLQDPTLAGFQEYSMENGKISDLQFYQNQDGVQILKFEIDNSEFIVKAETALHMSSSMGMRFVGVIWAHYPDGVKRRGVIKLEFNLK